MKTIIKATVLSSVILLSSCATIISGSRQTIEITSEPSTAQVFINEVQVGQTPLQKTLKRNQEYQLTLKLDGYKTYETKLKKKFNAWYIGNILLGGFVGLIIDPITGAMYQLKPEQIDGNLKSGTTYKTEDGNVFIKITMEIDPTMEKVGQLEKL
ncbi:PEGA domain-containing protein [Flavobacterium gelidilacus]|uniref:PEGA domain-containing protein n=1 Tax=Flavobacterium gelidilacus TaxID=206041 RepID=UPI0004041A91|nr:PEGA domain-containing protein [Flavobacterium gelidilacus]